MHIDPALEQELQRHPDKTVDVIVCFEGTTAPDAVLERAGFRATSREQAEHGVVYGRIRLVDLANLRIVKGIKSIELDSTQYAL